MIVTIKLSRWGIITVTVDHYTAAPQSHSNVFNKMPSVDSHMRIMVDWNWKSGSTDLKGKGQSVEKLF